MSRRSSALGPAGTGHLTSHKEPFPGPSGPTLLRQQNHGGCAAARRRDDNLLLCSTRRRE